MVFSGDDAARNARRRGERRAGLDHDKGDQRTHDILILWLNFVAFFRDQFVAQLRLSVLIPN